MRQKLLTVAALLAALLIAAAGCRNGTQAAPPDSGTAPDGTRGTQSLTSAVPADETGDFIIAENGIPVCSLVTGPGSAERTAAETVKLKLKETLGIDLPVKNAAGDPSEPEIVIGCFVDGIPADAYPFARYGSWCVGRSGSKLVVYALDEKSYGAAAENIPAYILRSSSDGTVKLARAFYFSETNFQLPVAIPPAEGAVASYVQPTGGSDTSKRCSQVGFRNVTEDFFDRYCEKLLSLSYGKVFENSFSSNIYRTFLKDGEMLSVGYFPSLHQMRIVSEPVPSTPVWELTSGERTGKVKLFQIEDTTKEHASCFIVTLADGRYLLYDTGVETTADQIYDYMQKNNRFSDGKIHIAAVIISHPHPDHMNGLAPLASKYGGKIVCDAVMYNLVSVDMQSIYDASELNGRQNTLNEAAKKLGAEVICLRAGQKFTLSGTDFEILFTPDELGDFKLTGKNAAGESDTTYDMNNSCLIVRMTEGGQETVFTGDCRGGEADLITRMFARGFSGDIMTVSHHGFNVTGTLWLYKTAKPRVLFWTITKDNADTSRSFVKQLRAADFVVRHFYEDTAVEITLPYDPTAG